MRARILELVKRIKQKVDAIEPLNDGKTAENWELRGEACNLLLLAIDKLENDMGEPHEQVKAHLEKQNSVTFEYCGKSVTVRPGTTLAELQEGFGNDLDILDIFRATWKIEENQATPPQ